MLNNTYSVFSFNVRVITLFIPYVEGENVTRTRLHVLNDKLYVEPATKALLEKDGYTVIYGKDVETMSLAYSQYAFDGDNHKYMKRAWRVNCWEKPDRIPDGDVFYYFLKRNPDIQHKWWSCFRGYRWKLKKGVPDLFVWDRKKNKEWFWVECKTENDNLSLTQWQWIERFSTIVSPHVTIARVYDKNKPHLYLKYNPPG